MCFYDGEVTVTPFSTLFKTSQITGAVEYTGGFAELGSNFVIVANRQNTLNLIGTWNVKN